MQLIYYIGWAWLGGVIGYINIDDKQPQEEPQENELP